MGKHPDAGYIDFQDENLPYDICLCFPIIRYHSKEDTTYSHSEIVKLLSEVIEEPIELQDMTRFRNRTFKDWYEALPKGDFKKYDSDILHKKEVHKSELIEFIMLYMIHKIHNKIGFVTYLFMSRDEDEIFLKIGCPFEENLKIIAEKYAYKLQMHEYLEDSPKFNEAPFYAYSQDEQMFFQKYDKTGDKAKVPYVSKEFRDNTSIFKPVDRLRLMFIAINHNFDLPLMKNRQLCKEYYPLHSRPDLEWLRENWALSRMNTLQPISKIRDYFGEKLAFYFAWLTFYTEWLLFPLIIGTPVFGILMWRFYADTGQVDLAAGSWENGDKVVVIDDYIFVYFTFLLFLIFWSICLTIFWERREKKLALIWGTLGIKKIEPPRPDFQGELQRNPVSEKMERYYAPSQRKRKLLASYSVLLTILGLVIVTVFAIFWLKFYVKNKSVFQGDSLIAANFVFSIANAVQIHVFNFLYGKLATKFTNWENHRLQSEYEGSLIYKNFAFKVVNSYNSFFYIAFMKERIECADVDLTDDQSCANIAFELVVQLVTVFAIQLVMNVIEILVPFITQRAAVNKETKSLKKLQKANPDKVYRELLCYAEAQAKLNDDTGTLNEYLELTIQYGFMLLFCVAFPMAPLLAMVSNLLEIRVDSVKMCYLTQRPEPERADSIGNWLKLMKVITVIGLVSNTGIIIFTLKGIRPTLNDEGKENTEGILWQYAAFVIVEHVMFIFLVIMQSFISDQDINTQDLIKRQDVITERYFLGDEGATKKIMAYPAYIDILDNDEYNPYDEQEPHKLNLPVQDADIGEEAEDDNPLNDGE